jgi:hypothetical protein
VEHLSTVDETMARRSRACRSMVRRRLSDGSPSSAIAGEQTAPKTLGKWLA